MKIKASLMAGLIAASPAVFGQDVEVATDPVGYVSVNLLAASDTRISVPMTRAPEFQGVPTAVAGSTITFDGINGAEGADFGDLDGHFIVVRNGDLAGVRATIVSNDANSVTVEDGVDLSGLATGSEGDSVQVIPHWTLATLFPAPGDDTRVLVFDDINTSGINLAQDRTYRYFEGSGWFRGATAADDDVIHIGESFIVRDSMGDPVNFVMAGSVPMFRQLLSVRTNVAGESQDNFFGLSVPVPVALGEISASDDDRILVPDNESSGINKAQATTYRYFEGSGWFRGATLADDEMLEPGVGYIYRKNATAEPEQVVITVTPDYLN